MSAPVKLTSAQRKRVREMMTDEGQTRAEAVAWVLAFEPAPPALSAEEVRALSFYVTSPPRMALVTSLCDRGLLALHGDGYALTDTGRAALEQVDPLDPATPSEVIDAGLIAMGVDPRELGKRGRAFIEHLRKGPRGTADKAAPTEPPVEGSAEG